uniref:Structural protein 1 n=1 Tax=Chipolycivirus sp. TaxID=2809300 RepID=A0AAU8JPY0_9VIRU
MTSIETTPLLNPTTETRLQNQILVSKPSLPDKFPVFSPLNRYNPPLPTEQFDVPGVAAMRKVLGKFNWSLSNAENAEIFALDLDWNLLVGLAPLGSNKQALFNADYIRIGFENTNNAMYQGALVVYYDPSPKDYWTDVMKVTLGSKEKMQFLTKALVEPKTRDSQFFDIPINIPFNLFQYYSSNTELQSYIRNYSFGSVRLFVLTQLETKSPTTSLNFRVTGEIGNYQTAGNKFV